MSGYALTPRAKLDLSDIWDYTAEHWGVEQADRYVRLITTACADVASGRSNGHSIEHIRAGYFRYPAGSHVLFYRRASGLRRVSYDCRSSDNYRCRCERLGRLMGGA